MNITPGRDEVTIHLDPHNTTETVIVKFANGHTAYVTGYTKYYGTVNIYIGDQLLSGTVCTPENKP